MKILFITHLSQKTTSINDIIHDSVLHGLREIYGNNVIDYPGAWYMYEEEVKKKNLTSKPFGAVVLLITIYYLIMIKSIERILKAES